jgi:hypothetical protein
MKYKGCDCGGEHSSTGTRAWCLDCSEWCYPGAICEIQELRNFQGKVRDLVLRMAHQAPDGSQADHDLWVELAELALGHG